MRGKQNNLKGTKKRKRKVPTHSVLPRLEGPTNSSKNIKVKVSKSGDSTLPRLKTSLKDSNGNVKVDDKTSINLLLPKLDRQLKRQKVSQRKKVSKEKATNSEDVPHKQKEKCVTYKKDLNEKDSKRREKSFNKASEYKANSLTRLGLVQEDFSAKNKENKQKCVTYKKDLKGRGLAFSKDSKTDIKRRQRHVNHLDTKEEPASDNVKYDYTTHCTTIKQPKQINLHLPFIADDSAKERNIQNRSVKKHIKSRTSFSQSYHSDLESQEPWPPRTLDSRRDSDIFDVSFGFDSNTIQRQTKREEEESKEPIKVSNTTKNVELLESGLNNCKNRGASESTMNPDEGFCEHDVIFEEVVDLSYNNYQSLHKTRLKTQTRMRNKTKTSCFTNTLEKLESGLDCNRGRGLHVLSAKEFKVEGLEIGLKEIPPKKKPRNLSLSFRKPKIASCKGDIKNDCTIQGSKVRGCSVDFDEYVIAMVRLVNCNDTSKQGELRDFPGGLFQGFP